MTASSTAILTVSTQCQQETSPVRAAGRPVIYQHAGTARVSATLV